MSLRFAVFAVGVIAAPHVDAANRSDMSTAKSSGAECVYPDPQKLLGPHISVNYSKADYLLANDPRGPTRWLFVSWEGPKDGAVFILSCDGRVLAYRGLGWFDKLDTGPSVNGQSTVEARYVSVTGSDVYGQSVSLLTFDGKSVRSLWDHGSYDSGAMSTTKENPKTHQIIWQTDIYTYDWKYAPLNTGSIAEIDVTGTHKVEFDDHGRTGQTRPEKYCYRPDRNKFLRC